MGLFQRIRERNRIKKVMSSLRETQSFLLAFLLAPAHMERLTQETEREFWLQRASSLETLLAHARNTVQDGVAKEMGHLTNTAIAPFVQKDIATARKALIMNIHRLAQERFCSKLHRRISDIISRFSGSMAPPSSDALSSTLEQTPLLPQGVRFIHYGPDYLIATVEQRPQMRSIRYIHVDDPITISLPYVVFVVLVMKGCVPVMRAFFRTTPLTSLNDHLLRAALPNIDPNGTVCIGQGNGGPVTTASYAERLTTVIDLFWSSFFTTSWTEGVVRARSLFRHGRAKNRPSRHEITTGEFTGILRDWETLSKESPSFVLSAQWESYPDTLSSVIQKLANTDRAVNPKDNAPEKILHDYIDRSAHAVATDIASACLEWLSGEHPSSIVPKSAEEMDGLLHEAVTRIHDLVAHAYTGVAETVYRKDSKDGTLENILRLERETLSLLLGDESFILATLRDTRARGEDK